jgi:hypothetical protein
MKVPPKATSLQIDTVLQRAVPLPLAIPDLEQLLITGVGVEKVTEISR